jgi:hypothetical protein
MFFLSQVLVSTTSSSQVEGSLLLWKPRLFTRHIRITLHIYGLWHPSVIYGGTISWCLRRTPTKMSVTQATLRAGNTIRGQLIRDRIIYRSTLLILICKYRVCRAQADWTFILPSELPAKQLRHLPRKMSPRDTTCKKYMYLYLYIFNTWWWPYWPKLVVKF